MSDILRTVAGIFNKRYRDMGDGTHAEVIALGGESVDVKSPEATGVLSGQITVTTAGTAVQGSNIPLTNGVFIKAMAGNSGAVYVGSDGEGDITALNGYELSAGESAIVQVGNLNELWFDAAESGDKFCWLKG